MPDCAVAMYDEYVHTVRSRSSKMCVLVYIACVGSDIRSLSSSGARRAGGV